MSKYSGNPFVVAKPAQAVADKFGDLTQLEAMMQRLPESERAKIGDVTFTTDSISINTNQVGNITFKVVERTPKKIVMKAQGTPVPMSLDIDLAEKSAESTEAVCSVDVDLPVFIKPMVAPHLNKAVNMLSEVIAKAVG